MACDVAIDGLLTVKKVHTDKMKSCFSINLNIKKYTFCRDKSNGLHKVNFYFLTSKYLMLVHLIYFRTSKLIHKYSEVFQSTFSYCDFKHCKSYFNRGKICERNYHTERKCGFPEAMERPGRKMFREFNIEV